MASRTNSTKGDKGSVEHKKISMECMVCLEPYNKNNRAPRQLSCGHTLCTECLAQLFTEPKPECPDVSCRQLMYANIKVASVPLNVLLFELIPEGEVEQPNKQVLKCSDCEDIAVSLCQQCGYLCEDHFKAHTKTTRFQTHSTQMMSKDQTKDIVLPTQLRCNKHNGELLNYFCLSCMEIGCATCGFKDHNSHKHTTPVELCKMISSNKLMLINSSSEQVKTLTKAADTIHQTEKNINLQSAEVIKAYTHDLEEVDKTLDRLKGVVAQRRSVLKEQLVQMEYSRTKILKGQREGVELAAFALQKSNDEVQQSANSNNHVKAAIGVSKLNKIYSTVQNQKLQLQPLVQSRIYYRPSKEQVIPKLQEVAQLLENFGYIGDQQEDDVKEQQSRLQEEKQRRQQEEQQRQQQCGGEYKRRFAFGAYMAWRCDRCGHEIWVKLGEQPADPICHQPKKNQ